MPVIVTYKVPFNTPWCLWMSKGNCVARKLQYQYSGVKKRWDISCKESLEVEDRIIWLQIYSYSSA